MLLQPKMVNSVGLSQAEVDELRRLVMAADRLSLESGCPAVAAMWGPARSPSRLAATPVILRQSDTKSSDAFESLCNWIERHSTDR